MKKIYVFDLDGTLSNCDHRQEFALNKDWDTFHSLCAEDRVYPNVKRLFIDLSTLDDNDIVIITGRDEAYRKQTEKWLEKNYLFPDELIMRSTGDYRKDSEFKIEAVCNFLGADSNAPEQVIAWFEDRDQLVEDLRNAGFTVLQVKAGAY